MPDSAELGQFIERCIQNPDATLKDTAIKAGDAAEFKKHLHSQTHRQVSLALDWEAQSVEHHILGFDFRNKSGKNVFFCGILSFFTLERQIYHYLPMTRLYSNTLSIF